jgi:hypothetical protein
LASISQKRAFLFNAEFEDHAEFVYANLVNGPYAIYTSDDEDSLRNLEINYRDDKQFKLNHLKIYNYDNVIVYITLKKIESDYKNEKHTNNIWMYESKLPEELDEDGDRIPFTRFTITSDDLNLNFKYITKTNGNGTDGELFANMFYPPESAEGEIADKIESIYGVTVSVYEHTDTVNDKYTEDNLITYLDGSKVVD